MSDAHSADDLAQDVLTLIPPMRAYARSLTRNVTDADDLVQETLVKALANIDKFVPGTKLRAWLFRIMRNTFLTDIHKRNRERPGAEDCVAGLLTVQPQHDIYLRGRRLMAAIATLPTKHREILILVVMMGESYEDAARLCDCAVGTVKSRVNRARRMVIAQLGEDELDDLVQVQVNGR